MKDNLRFNAIEKLAGDFYTKTEDLAEYESDSAEERDEESQDFNTWESQKKMKAKGRQEPTYTLSFGETEFVIRDNFETVTSDFKNSYQFALNGDALQIDKLRSVLNHSKRYKPTKMEIWVFEEAPGIFNYDEERTASDLLTHSQSISDTPVPSQAPDRLTPLNS